MLYGDYEHKKGRKTVSLVALLVSETGRTVEEIRELIQNFKEETGCKTRKYKGDELLSWKDLGWLGDYGYMNDDYHIQEIADEIMNDIYDKELEDKVRGINISKILDEIGFEYDKDDMILDLEVDSIDYNVNKKGEIIIRDRIYVLSYLQMNGLEYTNYFERNGWVLDLYDSFHTECVETASGVAITEGDRIIVLDGMLEEIKDRRINKGGVL